MVTVPRLCAALSLTAGLSCASVFVSPSDLSYQYAQGAALPANRNLTVTGGASFTVQVTTNPPGWLDVSPRSGTTPAVLVVRVNPTGLGPAQYLGLISVTDSDPRCSGWCSQTVRVTLTVSGTSPGSPSPSASATTFISQIADGETWKTTLTFVNSASVAARFVVRFWDDTGRALRLPLAGVGTTTVYSQTLPARGAQTVETIGSASAQLVQGWASIESESPGAIAATGIFRQAVPGRPDFEVGVPAQAAVRRLIFPFDHVAGFASGIAFVNTGETATIRLTFRDEGGFVLGTASGEYRSGEHVAFSISEAYPELANKRGTVEVVSEAQSRPGISALLLRFNPTGPATSLQPSYQGN